MIIIQILALILPYSLKYLCLFISRSCSPRL